MCCMEDEEQAPSSGLSAACVLQGLRHPRRGRRDSGLPAASRLRHGRSTRKGYAWKRDLSWRNSLATTACAGTDSSFHIFTYASPLAKGLQTQMHPLQPISCRETQLRTISPTEKVTEAEGIPQQCGHTCLGTAWCTVPTATPQLPAQSTLLLLGQCTGEWDGIFCQYLASNSELWDLFYFNNTRIKTFDLEMKHTSKTS